MAIINVTVDSLPESDTVPAGQYHLRIDEVNGPEDDKNNVPFIKIVYTITDGEYTNRKIFDNYIPLEGKSTLRKLLKAVDFGGDTLADTEELVGGELEAVIGVTKSDLFGEQNNIRMYIAPGKVYATAGVKSFKKPGKK